MWKVASASALATGLLLFAFVQAQACPVTDDADNCEAEPGCVYQPPCTEGTRVNFKAPGPIARVQKDLGVTGDPVGKLGPETEAAIRKFQEEKKLKVKEPGKLDFETYKALRLDKLK